MTEQLKECPHCGSHDVELITNSIAWNWWNSQVFCNGCGMLISNGEYCKTEAEAEETMTRLWNTRHERTCHRINVHEAEEYDLIEIPEEKRRYGDCSECGEGVWVFDSFCPNCGARVVSG